jgi:predicted nucleotidyltransferase
MSSHLSNPTPGQDPVMQTFAAALRQRLGPHLCQMVLFGSRARGNARHDSDYDVLVVVDHRTPELRAMILDVESQLMDRYGALVATVLRSEEEWACNQGFPLARNIAREGVSL